MSNEDKSQTLSSKVSAYFNQKGFGWIVDVEEENDTSNSLLYFKIY